MDKTIKSATSEQHVTESNAQLVASRVNHFQKRGYSELEALAITFNLSMFEKEQKKFKEYVEFVSELTNGFETPNKVAYEKTTDYTIIYEWVNFLKEHYPAYKELSEADTIDTGIDSPYNTYRYTGLTPTPIANPGLSSLKAALSPADSPYYYYVLDPATGAHHFSKTYEEHRKVIAEVQNKNNPTN